MPEIGAGGRSREVWLAFRRITGVNLVVHLLGAVLTFCYFRFMD